MRPKCDRGADMSPHRSRRSSRDRRPEFEKTGVGWRWYMARTERRSVRRGPGHDPGSCLTLSVGTPESIRMTRHVIESRTGPPTTVRSCNAVTSRCGSRRTRSDPGSPGLRGNEADRDDAPRWLSRARSRYAWSSISHCVKPRTSFDRASRSWGSASRYRITPRSRDAARIPVSDSVVQLPASPSISSSIGRDSRSWVWASGRPPSMGSRASVAG